MNSATREEMVERVARAMCPEDLWVSDAQFQREHYRDLAKRAIGAMREPTPEMLATVAPIAMVSPSLDCYDLAGKAIALLPLTDNPDVADVLAQMVQDHRAMIDAALYPAIGG